MTKDRENKHPWILGENWPYKLQEAIFGDMNNEIRNKRDRWKYIRVRKMMG
jgi:hypothetical protein